MLNYIATGPRADGSWLVAHQVPGLQILAADCECASQAQAEQEADRLNAQQRVREDALWLNCKARGMRFMIHRDLHDRGF